MNDPKPDKPLGSSPGLVIDECDSPSSWVCSKGTTVRLDPVIRISGAASLNMTNMLPGGAAGTGEGFSIKKTYRKVLNLSQMDNVQLNVFVPDTSLIDHIAIIFHSDAVKKWNGYTYWIGAWRLVDGWNRMDILKTEFSKVDMPSWSRINCVEVVLLAKKGCKTGINIDRLAYNTGGQPKVLFTFDDGWYDLVDESIKNNAFSCLSKKGFDATVWAIMSSSAYGGDKHISGADGRPAYLDESDLDMLYKAGWDIGNHTVSHPDNLDNMSDEQIRQEYGRCQQWLLDRAWTRGAYFACYPSGYCSERLTDILKELGVKAARTTIYGLQPAPADNMLKLKCIFVDDLHDQKGNPILGLRGGHVKDIDKVKREIDKAVETGSTLIFMFHKIEDTGDYLALSTSDFSRIVDYVYKYSSAKKLEVTTISEWYEDYIKKAG